MDSQNFDLVFKVFIIIFLIFSYGCSQDEYIYHDVKDISGSETPNVSIKYDNEGKTKKANTVVSVTSTKAEKLGIFFLHNSKEKVEKKIKEKEGTKKFVSAIGIITEDGDFSVLENVINDFDNLEMYRTKKVDVSHHDFHVLDKYGGDEQESLYKFGRTEDLFIIAPEIGSIDDNPYITVKAENVKDFLLLIKDIKD